MLYRRNIRHRILQSLYSYYQHEDKDIAATEKQLHHGIERTYELYLFLLSSFSELMNREFHYHEEAQFKFLEASKPHYVRTLTENFFIKTLLQNKRFNALVKKHHISWQDDMELIKKIYQRVRSLKEYNQYVLLADATPEDDVMFCTWMFKKIFFKWELAVQQIQEKNIFWADSYYFAAEYVLKTIKNLNAQNNYELMIPSMYRDEKSDRDFIHTLLFECVKNDAYYAKLITEKAKNWELDRIALLDIILMKMCLTELIYMQEIPVKVSLNEYLDIAKEFSTPKSMIFINGIMDRLISELKSEKKINKTGKGLLE